MVLCMEWLTFLLLPFSLFKLSCHVSTQIAAFVILAWLHLVKAVVGFQVYVFWKVTFLLASLVSLPVRILITLKRGRQFEEYLEKMQTQLHILVLEKEQLEDHLEAALSDRNTLEVRVAAAWEEHDKAFEKVQQVETELCRLREENSRLKTTLEQVDGKGRSGKGSKYCLPDSGFIGRDAVIFQDFLLQSLDLRDERNFQAPFFQKVEPKSILGDLYGDELTKKKCKATQRSLFSTFLSLLVGIIICESGEPCRPLIVALSVVVGISLKSVVQFFSAISVKPAADAVGLLTFNCFILGAVTYPILPTIGCILLRLF